MMLIGVRGGGEGGQGARPWRFEQFICVYIFYYAINEDSNANFFFKNI